MVLVNSAAAFPSDGVLIPYVDSRLMWNVSRLSLMHARWPPLSRSIRTQCAWYWCETKKTAPCSFYSMPVYVFVYVRTGNIKKNNPQSPTKVFQCCIFLQPLKYNFLLLFVFDRSLRSSQLPGISMCRFMKSVFIIDALHALRTKKM